MDNDLYYYRIFTSYLDDELRKAYAEYINAYNAISPIKEHQNYNLIKEKLLETYNYKVAQLKRQADWIKSLIVIKVWSCGSLDMLDFWEK